MRMPKQTKMPKTSKPNKQSKTAELIKTVLRKNLLLTLAMLGMIVLVVVISLLPPQLLRVIIDQNLNISNSKGLMPRAILYLILILLIAGMEFINGWLLTVFGQKTMREMRKEMMEKLSVIPAGYFTANAPGTIASRFISDVENVNTLFADGLVSMIIDCFKILGIVISIWIFSPVLALIALLLIPVIGLVTRYFKRQMQKAQQDNLIQLGRVNNHIAETMKNVSVIKLFSKEKYMEETYEGRLKQNYATKQKVNGYDASYAPIIQILRAIVITLIVVLSCKEVHLIGITAGMIAASIELISNLLKPIEALGMELQNIQQGISGIKRIDEFLALPEERKQESLKAADILSKGRDVTVTFDHVHFYYEEEHTVIDDLTLMISPGTSVTLAGRTGVGKTTLFQLIMGLLRPVSGSIQINGQDASLIPDKEKRKIFGYVVQNFLFVPGTVADQITLYDPDISMERVKEVCQFVGLHETIEAMKDGYHTKIETKQEFSWGQRQLLSIARAIAADPPILLLDEITANLDSATEDRVVTVLNHAREGRTILSISHRSTSMMHCDQLIELKSGKVEAIHYQDA